MFASITDSDITAGYFSLYGKYLSEISMFIRMFKFKYYFIKVEMLLLKQ